MTFNNVLKSLIMLWGLNYVLPIGLYHVTGGICKYFTQPKPSPGACVISSGCTSYEIESFLQEIVPTNTVPTP